MGDLTFPSDWTQDDILYWRSRMLQLDDLRDRQVHYLLKIDGLQKQLRKLSEENERLRMNLARAEQHNIPTDY